MVMKKYFLIAAFPYLCLFACNGQQQNNTDGEPTISNMHATEAYPLTGTIQRFDSAINRIIDPDAKIEIVAEGFKWSEGPLLVPQINTVLFSDVPENTIYSWNEKQGLNKWLTPSGYTGEGQYSREGGSNGLLLDAEGRLVLCQHGDRRMARLLAPLHAPAPKFETIADTYQGKRFNSPNDAAYDASGNLYFTDPPYGLPGNRNELGKELDFQGVYKVKPDGTVILLVDSLTRPNGIAVFPGGKSLLIANSDPQRVFWYIYDLNGDGLSNGRIFYEANGLPAEYKGLPDGLKIDANSHVFASGPGGIYIFDAKGKKLGLIKLNDPASNVALSQDEKILYITNNNYLLRVKMRS
jgi:gluconolactonase